MKSRLLVLVVVVTAALVLLLGEAGAALAGGDAEQQAGGRLLGWLVSVPVALVVAGLVKAMVPAGWLPAVAGTRPSAGYRSGWGDRLARRLGVAAQHSTEDDLAAVRAGTGVHVRAILVDPVESGALLLPAVDGGAVRMAWKRTGRPAVELRGPYRVSTGTARANPLADRMGFPAVVQLGTADGAKVLRMRETDRELLQQLVGAENASAHVG
ncbi:hypothetical protein GCM10010441_67620 [Kitasatospora paracochleata]|uniref:Uncharacterized protein n=1 Tax=Kitasatospora paracochleata TaxID=58354 RepID=A0ABT1J5D6_9ACTN|nr:hypothetical protein [Kitasatospora paracochleata]MCP2312650.1 hypothetical protein [Kitasatospora paracochleata]